ncbi:MAG TPA: glycoside hydrolase family 76 protein, partial [Solirubrobacteraceae bacterium]|nr:glycoside hydrolase family 76 protein [Solirubrobacteraceae bacterium]
FASLIRQWDPRGGGIFWQMQTSPHASRQRAAVSNAPVATLGADLYQQTHNRSYLRWARRIFAWTNRVLLDHRTGLYDDHIDGNGRLSTVKRSYVQGVEIGAMTALQQSAPRAYPLSDTVRFAERTMAYFSNCNSTGSAEFRAVYFQNLLWLAHRAPSGRLLANIKRCMVNAIRHLTPQPFLLRNAAGAAEMIALNALPVRAYAKLF